MFKKIRGRTSNWVVKILMGIGCCLGALAQPAAGQPAPFDKDALMVRDSILFRNGTKLFGSIKSEGIDDDGRKYVVFESNDKTVMKLDVSRLLSKAPQTLDPVDLAYNKMVANMADTAEAHRKAYQWCEDQSGGSVRFERQIRFHCERVMELDPNDTAVKHRLDYDFIEEQDRWVPEELFHQAHGYQKKGTSWAPMLRQNSESREDQAKATEAERRSAYRRWRTLFKKKVSATELQNELFQFCDAYAIPFLFEEAKEEKDPRVRMMFVEAFGRVSTYAAMEALAYFSVEGVPSAVADRALDLLLQEHYNPAQASARIAGEYFNQIEKRPNGQIQRAAFVIGELGSEDSILPLINVLTTTHIVAPGDQPGRMNTTFDSNGVSGFTAGGDSSPKKLAFQNPTVVNALKKITEQDFQYSSDAWKHWYIENHTLYDATLRPSRR